MFNSAIQSQTGKAKSHVQTSVRKIKSKTLFKYVLVFCLFLVLPSGLFYFNYFVPTKLFWGVQAWALLLGFVHVWQMGKRFGWRNQFSLKSKLLLSISILIAAMIFTCILLFFYKPAHGLYVLFSSSLLPFIFPLLFFSVYDYSISIPKPLYKTWKYTFDMKLPDMDSIDFSNSYIVTLQLNKSEADFNDTFMKFKAPLDRLTFGELFYLYMNEYNDKHREYPIQYLNSLQQPFEWVFYVKPSKWWKFKSYIDPSLTMRENKIRENYIVKSERIKS